MIKYATIPNYITLGEVQFGSHMYQLREKENPGNNKIVLIRAYDCESIIWTGYIYNSTKTYINGQLDMDLTDVKKILPDIKYVHELKEFLKGHNYEEDFQQYTIV